GGAGRGRARRRLRPAEHARAPRSARRLVQRALATAGRYHHRRAPAEPSGHAPGGFPGMSQVIRVLLVDDHEIVREGVRAVLEDESDIEVVGEASDGTQALERVRALTPDVVLLDLVMPGPRAADTIRGIRAAAPATQVLMLTSFAEDE